jgi:hypothetical protein
MLAALSGQRLGGLSVDDRGNLSVGSGGRAGPVAALTPPDRDLCFLALKLALVETLLGPGKLLALADDAFASLPEVSRRAAARLMKQVARTGQLLHATPDVVFREAADHLA